MKGGGAYPLSGSKCSDAFGHQRIVEAKAITGVLVSGSKRHSDVEEDDVGYDKPENDGTFQPCCGAR